MKKREHFEATMGHKLDLEPIEYAGGEFHYYENTTTQLAWEAYQAAVPEGWQAAPCEADAKMVRAGIERGAVFGLGAHYAAMLKHAPELPVQREAQ